MPDKPQNTPGSMTDRGFIPAFEPTEQLTDAEQLTGLVGKIASWVDTHGQPPAYPPDTLYVTAESGHLPLLDDNDHAVTEFTLTGEALDRFKEREPDITARLHIGDVLALSHTAPHYIYMGEELPASPDDIGEDFREADPQITCYVSHPSDSPLESTSFFITKEGRDEKEDIPRDNQPVIVGSQPSELAGRVTRSDYENLVELVAGLERNPPSTAAV